MIQNTKIKTLLLTLFIVPFLTLSQEEQGRISLGAFIMPEMNGLLTRDLVGKETVDMKIGFSLGLNVEFRLTEKLAMRSGLGYGLKRYTHLAEGLFFGSDISPTGGYLSESRIESKISYSEIQFPLLLQVKFNSGFFFAFGIELNGAFANNSKRTIYYGGGTTSELNNQSGMKLNYAAMFSLGYTIPNSSLSIEPMLKYYFKDYLIHESNQYNLGLRITYNFVN